MARKNPPEESTRPGATDEDRSKPIDEKLRKVGSVASSQAKASAKAVKEHVQVARKRLAESSVLGGEHRSSDEVADPGADDIAETVKIAEKVKFWEEQDRINKELIPRVLKQHELFTEHVEHHDDVSSAIAGVESRMAIRLQEVEESLRDHLEEVAKRGRKKGNLLLAAAALALAVAVVSLVLSLVS